MGPIATERGEWRAEPVFEDLLPFLRPLRRPEDEPFVLEDFLWGVESAWVWFFPEVRTISSLAWLTKFLGLQWVAEIASYNWMRTLQNSVLVWSILVVEAIAEMM